MTARASSKAKLPFRRRAERVVLGAVMGVIAFVIEKRVLKGIKESAAEAPKRESGDRGLTGGLGSEGFAVAPNQDDA